MLQRVPPLQAVLVSPYSYIPWCETPEQSSGVLKYVQVASSRSDRMEYAQEPPTEAQFYNDI